MPFWTPAPTTIGGPGISRQGHGRRDHPAPAVPPRRASGRGLGVVLAVVTVLASLVLLPEPARTAGPRITLEVLVVDDGGPAVAAIVSQLASEGVPRTVVDLHASGRPVITADYLAGTSGGVAVARFQGVVLPNENPFGDGSAEMAALIAYEKQFGIRQLDAATFASPSVGLNFPVYTGALDGRTGTVSASARSAGFGYLAGPVNFDDDSSTVTESYGYLATPLPDDSATNSHFEPLVTAPTGGDGTGALVGVYTHDGRSELVVTFVYLAAQTQFQVLAHGFVTWLTNGVHLGYQRNYLALHVDDVFATGGRWSTDHNCTPGDDCPVGSDGESTVTTAPIRMSAADVDALAAWQSAHGFTVDLYFNGGGSDEYVTAHGSDPLLTALQAKKSQFRWGNHTLTHDFLGCVQNFTVVPWTCQRDASGAVTYQTKQFIKDQISQNILWAALKGLSVDGGELVTGEHSGFFVRPQQPQDNPNLAAAFSETGVKWAGSDNSRDPTPRTVGSAVTVPRHPVDIFFNAATKTEEVDEYNWIYTSRADGGSGLCEDNPQTTTCITPLAGSAAFDSYLVPLQTRTVLSHVLSNDPRPHYVHQSNFTEDRIMYPVLDSLFSRYTTIYAASAPMVNLRLRDISTRLSQQAAWRGLVDARSVSGYLQDGRVTVTAPADVEVPVTAPEGTRTVNLLGTQGELYGVAYGGERSAWTKTSALSRTVTLALPT